MRVSAFHDHSVLNEFLSVLRLGVVSAIFKNKIVPKTPPSSSACKTDWVSGASMLIRSEVFKVVQELDENFFMYYEEVDFCIRARKAGYQCWYVPESRVIHLEGVASGISAGREISRRRPAYWFESRRFFFLKHHGAFSLFLADTLWIAGYSTWLIRQLIQKKENIDPPRFLRDFISHSVFFKGFG